MAPRHSFWKPARRVSVVAFVSAVATVTLMALPTAASATTGAPWSFHLDYNEQVQPSLACGGLALTDVGTVTGDGSLVTRGHWTSTECIDFLIHPGAFTERDGNFVITTTTGVLDGTYNGSGTLTGILHIRTSANVKLTGGTGSFAGVTGCGHALGTSNLLNSADNHTDGSGHFGC